MWRLIFPSQRTGLTVFECNSDVQRLWKSSCWGVAVREDFSLWIFFLKNGVRRLQTGRSSKEICFSFLLLTPSTPVKDLFLHEQGIRMRVVHFQKSYVGFIQRESASLPQSALLSSWAFFSFLIASLFAFGWH